MSIILAIYRAVLQATEASLADRLDQLARTSVVVFSAACSVRSGR